MNLAELTKDNLLDQLQKKSGAEFFHDQYGNTFAWTPILDGTEHFECHLVDSRAFQARLIQLAEFYFKESPTTKMIKDVIETVKLLAFKEAEKKLTNRHRSHENQIIIDLGDRDWRQVTVTTDGYKIEPQSEPIFFRPQHM